MIDEKTMRMLLAAHSHSIIREVLNAIAEGILIIDRNYSIVFANKAMLDLCGGLRAADLYGRKCHEIFHRCPTPCPEKCLSDIVCPHDEVFTNEKETTVVHRHAMPDNREKTFSITSSPVRDKDGHVIWIVEVLSDITEQRQAEEALRKSEAFMKDILESVDEGFIIIDRDYRIVSANRAYCEQAKLSSCDIIGRHCYEVSHHRDNPCFFNGVECAPSRTFKTGVPSLAIHTHHDSEGKPVYIETRSYPIKDDSGGVTAVIETLNNITEIRRLEEQLRHAQKMEAIGTLAGGIAHDFNNILSAIVGYGGLMQIQMKDDDPARPHLAEILAAGKRAAELTKGLLAFSRKQVMTLKNMNVNDIIADFKRMIERIIGEDIEFRIITAAKEMIVKVDTGQIEQVLMNLAANARDAMPKGGTLTIETLVTNMDSSFINVHGFGEPGRYATIIVTDTGIGMEEATRQRIFDPYFTTKGLGRGTGLGLSIAFGIVRQHKGFLECQSEPDKGTTFKIYLPVVQTEKEKEVEKIDIAVLLRGVETVLIAEDEPVIRILTRKVLEDHGYTVIEAVDGEDAVSKFRDNKERITLLVLDVIMPKKTGKEVYEEIKQMKPDIKALFISGYAGALIQDRGLSCNGLEFVQKPILPRDLLKRIREILDK